MQKVRLAVVFLLLVACSKEKVRWTQQQLEAMQSACVTEISTLVRDNNNLSPICICWLDNIERLYTYDQMNSDDDAIYQESNNQLKGCAESKGEHIRTLFGSI